jgi:hypothetical protein
MIQFTGRSIYNTKIPNKPIIEGYNIFWMAEKRYVWEFYPSSDTWRGDPVDEEFNLLQLADTGIIAYYLMRRVHHIQKLLSFDVYMGNILLTQPSLEELYWMAIGECGTCIQQFGAIRRKLKIATNAKLH